MDPNQICYLCERSLNLVGRASKVLDKYGNSIGNPGVCIECDAKNNPAIQAEKERIRRLQGALGSLNPGPIAPPSSNPLHAGPVLPNDSEDLRPPLDEDPAGGNSNPLTRK